MKIYEEIIDIVYNILKYAIIISLVVLITLFSYRYGCDVMDGLTHRAEAQITVTSEGFQKPTYEYLKSVTVYIVHNEGLDQNGKPIISVGTGTVVDNVNGEFQILTNKHVCGIETNDPEVFTTDVDHCYISLDGNPRHAFLKLQYVKSAKQGVDLELWKIQSILLPTKSIVRGFNTSNIQDPVYSTGHYLGIPFIYSEGTMAGYEGNDELFNMPSAPGCSGSGIFNSNGEVIAVLFAGNMVNMFSMDTAKALAVSGKNVKEFLGK